MADDRYPCTILDFRVCLTLRAIASPLIIVMAYFLDVPVEEENIYQQNLELESKSVPKLSYKKWGNLRPINGNLR